MTFSSTSSPGREASAQALHGLSIGTQKTMGDKIVHILQQAHQAGVRDLSGREIQARYQQQFGQFVEMSSLSGRINNLMAAGRVERLQDHRPCTVTGLNIAPVRLVPKQGSLT